MGKNKFKSRKKQKAKIKFLIFMKFFHFGNFEKI